jgi:galactokinase
MHDPANVLASIVDVSSGAGHCSGRSVRFEDPLVTSRESALFVPGRLCLFGEHSDWAGGFRRSHPEIAPGFCLVAGTDQGLRGVAARDDAALALETVLADGERRGPERFDASPAALGAAAARADFWSHAAGAAAEVMERCAVGGLSLSIRSDLPARAGLSSSAAVCVLVVRAYSRVYSLDLAPDDEMALAYAGERRTGSACGRMDQVCALGRGVSALSFDGDAMNLDRVEVGGAFPFLIADLRRGKDTRRILRDLQACFPDAPGARAARVRDALGAANRALHVHARAALEAGDVESLGALSVDGELRRDPPRGGFAR